jgi:hypothetical protein
MRAPPGTKTRALTITDIIRIIIWRRDHTLNLITSNMICKNTNTEIIKM